jgi:hypothetical protein
VTVLAQVVYDAALNNIVSNANKVVICSQEPATYTEANSTYKLGEKTSVTVGSPSAGSPDGRQVTVPAVTGGTVTASGTATHHALIDTVNSVLYAAKSLSASQAVTSGNTYSATAYTIRIPAAV